MATVLDDSVVTPEGESRDLGFGAVVARERKRLLNRDGSFNVSRVGMKFWRSHSLYHTLLTMTWPRFLGLIVAFYLVSNLIFGIAFFACGPGALAGATAVTAWQVFARAFFFSIQTFGTIGYGTLHPVGTAANLLVAAESLFGLLGFALATGLMFARFSRPMANIAFSKRGVIAPYQNGRAFMLRLANTRSTQLIEVEARIVLGMFVDVNGTMTRRFTTLKLERAKVAFLPLTWTVVHPLDESSPLHGMAEADFEKYGVEFLVLLTGIDETFSQTVHARMSYRYDEILWHARFCDIFGRSEDAEMLTVDISRIDAIEPLQLA